MLLLFPSDPLRPRRIDEHWADERDAARDLEIVTALVDHDAIVAGRADEAVRAVPAADDAVYRGWMIRPRDYAALEQSLSQRGVRLRTSADDYTRAHELPGWYDALAGVTPRSEWTTGFARDDFEAARARLAAAGVGDAMVRDYSKSAKHHWDEAVWLPADISGQRAWQVASRLLELREDDAAGGFVVREFESLAKAELRTWWVDGVCVESGPHPDPADLDPGTPPTAVFEHLGTLIGGLQLGFVTADLALRADGQWRLVELGDGQVSDLAGDPGQLMKALVASG